MDNKWKYIWGGIVLVALVFAGFLWYQSYARKGMTAIQSTPEGEGFGSLKNTLDDSALGGGGDAEEDDTDYNAICEKGERLKIADLTGEMSTVSGKLRKTYPDDEANAFKNYQYHVEGAESLGVTGDNIFKLDYFEDREVEIQGVKNAAKKEIAVAEVKCGGTETDKNVLDQRKNLMNWLAANIDSVAPQKAKYRKWTVDIADIVDEKNVYVEYYDAIEDDENSDIEDDTSRKVLVEASAKSDGSFEPKILAYWEMGEDDYVLKTGTDKFEDVEDVFSYQYDPEKKIWERID